MKKRNRLFICLVAGVLILAVSATAAFGSINGYSKYKEAVKSLALESDNFTANGTMKGTYDGKEIFSIREEYAMDGHNMYSHHVTTEPNGNSSEDYMTALDGKRISFYTDSDVYYEYEDYDTDNTAAANLLGIDADDEMTNRLVKFAELAADTVVGELKNNFVQVGKENGSTLYQVEIAKNQVPSLVNAGLSLFAYSVGHSRDYCMVTYEDCEALMLHLYEKATGETLSEEFKENYTNGYTESWYEANQALVDKVDEFNCQNWEEPYWDVLNEKNTSGTGVVYVKADGSYDYYPDYAAYKQAHPEEVSMEMENYVGEDMTLEKVLCNFGVDDQGNLTSNSIEVTFTTVDADGGQHTLVITGDVTVTNYGTTTVQPLDVGGRERYESASSSDS